MLESFRHGSSRKIRSEASKSDFWERVSKVTRNSAVVESFLLAVTVGEYGNVPPQAIAGLTLVSVGTGIFAEKIFREKKDMGGDSPQ